MMRTGWAGWGLLAALALPPQARAAPLPEHYRVTPVSGKYVSAAGLNDAGRYGLNNAAPDSPWQLATIEGGGRSDILGSLGGYTTRIRALNNRGQAVGESSTATGANHAFLYAGGALQDLTARYGLAAPVALNEHGAIAGQTLDFRAAVLADGTVDAFGPVDSTPADINEAGQVLFEYAPAGAALRAALYRDGAVSALPRFAGSHLGGYALNDAGWVTGYATTALGRYHAYVFDGGTVTDLTPWSGTSFGYDIDNLGQVVGTVDGRAFLYGDGRLVDLNTLIDPEADLLLTDAFAINGRGQILAASCDRAGVFCYGTMLLDPVPAVPEPARGAALAAGLALLAALRLRGAPPHWRRARR